MRAFLACLLVACAAPATPRPQAPSPPQRVEAGWGIVLPGETVARDVAFDGEGNVYVTGSFRSEIDLGPGPVEALGAQDAFLVSYDALGAHRWSRRFGDGGTDSGLALATSEREVAVLASVDQAAELGGALVRFRPERSGQTQVAFLARYQRDGAFVGFTTLDEQGPFRFEAVTANETGGFLVAGTGRGDVSSSAPDVGYWPLRVAAIGATGWRHHFGRGFSEHTTAGVSPHGDGALVTIRVERGVEGIEGPTLVWMRVGADGVTPLRALGPGIVLAQEPMPTGDGALVLLELTEDTEFGRAGTMLASLNPDGSTRWVSPTPGARDLAVGDGRIVVVANHARELQVREVGPTDGRLGPPLPVATGAIGARIALGAGGALAIVAHHNGEAELAGRPVGPAGSFLVWLPGRGVEAGPRGAVRLERVGAALPGGAPTAGAEEVSQARAVDDALVELIEGGEDHDEARPFSATEQTLVDAVREATDRQYGQVVVSRGFALLHGPDGPVVVHAFGHGRWHAWVERLRRRRRLGATIARAERIQNRCFVERRAAIEEAETRATALEAVAGRTGAETDEEAAYEARDLVDEMELGGGDECADEGWQAVYPGEDGDRICGLDTTTVEVRALEGTPERPQIGRVLGSRSIEVCFVDNDDQDWATEPLPTVRDAPERIQIGDVDGDDLPEAVVHVAVVQPIGDVGRGDFFNGVLRRHLWVFRHDGNVEVALEEEMPEDQGFVEPSRASSVVRWRAEDVNGDGRVDLVREHVQLRRVCHCEDILSRQLGRARPTALELSVDDCVEDGAEVRGGCLPLGPPERSVRLYDPATDRFGEAEAR